MGLIKGGDGQVALDDAERKLLRNVDHTHEVGWVYASLALHIWDGRR